ncbi:hypothetical protein LU604_08675 [Erwinia tracheiphila]|uniref:Uncharacterized protein n=1 Tax=Erwinia tracheiphila TaxID=65700 RepID=A0A345CSI6_9GAMM|nr:hypothetical protein [Erwinia tracheiphila]AXF76403.1 hypothetical protein AV903_10615 [Erwinia tracheiphila]UIA84937.1 hypothetical protein LU604_08675 [Erwinia tracheiphila]UIA93534.1 hypothetical protein LU632_08640 [Erwinia tracheiphila]
MKKKQSSEKGITKEIVSVNNSLAELTISSNNPCLTTYNINEKKPKESETAHHLAGEIIKNVRNSHNPVTGGNVPLNSQNTKSEQKSNIIRRLQHKQESFEDAVERFPTCDVKIQELLKSIRSDKELWKEVNDKLEIRVIKAKDEEIVFHPENEKKERWSGKYHVYLTVNNEDKRFVIDPYIGGEKSCAHIDEQDFIKSYWKGKERKEYILETIAPVNENYGDNDNYTPEFSISDYIDNLFDPDTFESHKFYYG